MHIENKFSRFMRNSGPARVLVPMGIILIIAGVLLMMFKSDNYAETAGKVVAVTENTTDEENRQYDVEVAYTVGGKDYTTTFTLSKNYKEGDEIKVFYDADNPEKTTNGKIPSFVGPVVIAVGAVAAVFGVYRSVKSFKKSKELDEKAPASSPEMNEAFAAIKDALGVREYYFRFDGHGLKPGYIVEDADRKVLFEGKMTKNALVGARTFEFHDHVKGTVEEHQVGHTTTESFNNEFFSQRSTFKFDGKDVWDVIHDKGLRINTDIRSKFPKLVYELSKSGAALARIETSSIYVHEDDEAAHSLAIPAGNMYYRFWTASDDLGELFLAIFAISETEQTIVE